jgi:hypothetical protein
MNATKFFQTLCPVYWRTCGLSDKLAKSKIRTHLSLDPDAR